MLGHRKQWITGIAPSPGEPGSWDWERGTGVSDGSTLDCQGIH